MSGVSNYQMEQIFPEKQTKNLTSLTEEFLGLKLPAREVKSWRRDGSPPPAANPPATTATGDLLMDINNYEGGRGISSI